MLSQNASLSFPRKSSKQGVLCKTLEERSQEILPWCLCNVEATLLSSNIIETGMLCVAFQTHCLLGDLKCKSWPSITHGVSWLICNYLWERLMTLLQPSSHTSMPYNNSTLWWNVHCTSACLSCSGGKQFSAANIIVCSVQANKMSYRTLLYWIHKGCCRLLHEINVV